VPTLPDGEEAPAEPPPGEGTPAPTTPPAEPPTGEPTTAPPPDLEASQARMVAAEEELAAAYESGDFGRLAAALEEWVAAREELAAAQAAAGG
jgi:hypothetical protein